MAPIRFKMKDPPTPDDFLHSLRRTRSCPSGAPQGCTKTNEFPVSRSILFEKTIWRSFREVAIPYIRPMFEGYVRGYPPKICSCFLMMLRLSLKSLFPNISTESTVCWLTITLLLREDVPDMCQTPRQTFTRILIDSWCYCCYCYRETPQYLGLKPGVSSICSNQTNIN